MTKNNTATSKLTASALIVSLLAVCSWISIPLPGTGVPVNLATFAVILSGLVLGSGRGAGAVAVFLLLGAAGVPVFHSFTGGIGILTGPTGGFLIGYLALSWMAGTAFAKSRGVAGYVLAVIVGEAGLYALGTLWYMATALGGVGSSEFAAAVFACVVPFLPGDAAKAAVAYIIFGRLSHALK